MSAYDREKWNARYSAPERAEDIPQAPSAELLAWADQLPLRGRALDVAGGAGRHAVWLAQQGLEVTLADISVAGLALAQQRAQAAGVSLHCLETDLEEAPFPAGPWDVIVVVCFLVRDIFPQLTQALAPSGLLLVIQPTTTNLERHPRPPAEFLLAPGELHALARGPARALEIVSYAEGWSRDNRHDAVLVARRR